MIVRIGVVGLGYWGPNLARNFASLSGCELAWCCDGSDAARAKLEPLYPQARFTDAIEDLLADPRLDAIVLATPVITHAPLALRVLAAGKHCFVEKPLAYSVDEAQEMVDAARTAERILMVGHVFEYHPAVVRLKELIDSGDLGRLFYIHSTRVNLGQLRSDENALWSLGAHDVSIALSIAGEMPYELEAQGGSYMQEGIEDIAFCFMRFPSGVSAHFHLSWLDPHKERVLRVVGSKRMATFDAMPAERQLTVYDKGFDTDVNSHARYVTRFGDTWSPSIPRVEALLAECEHFVACVAEGRTPLTDGESGLRVVRVLDGLQRSMQVPRLTTI